LRYIFEVLGTYAWEENDSEQALYYFNLAGEIQYQTEEGSDEADSYQKLATKSQEEGDDFEALEYYQKALEFRVGVLGESNPSTIGCYNYIARTLIKLDDYDDALSACQTAISLYCPDFSSENVYSNPTDVSKASSYQHLLDVLILKFKVLSGNPDNDEAVSSANEVVDLCLFLIDQLRTGRKPENTKIFWTENVLPFYEDVLSFYYNLNIETPDLVNRVFVLMEKSKAFILTQANQKLSAERIANIPEETLNKERDIRNDISALERFIYMEEKHCEEADVNKLDIWQDELNRLETELYSVISKLEKNYPRYHELKYDISICQLSEVQGYLVNGEVMLEYFYGDSSVYFISISNDSYALHRIRIDDEFNNSVKGFRSFLTQPGISLSEPQAAYESYVENALFLFNALIPLKDLPPRLIVVPDGELHYLCFDAMLTQSPESSSRDYSLLDYLIKSSSTIFQSSATQWCRGMTSATGTKGAYCAFAPDYNSLKSTSRQAEELEYWESVTGLQHNRQEVEAGQMVFGGDVYVGDQALESFFRQQVPNSSVLHLAMHTFIDDDNPMYSGFMFQEPEDSINDGILLTSEIYNLNLNSNLAVLSSCNTGIGNLRRGEGILSLSRAFGYAGCPTIVMSLWECDDVSTSSIVSQFFRGLSQDMNVAAALRSAKMDYLQQADPATAHPFYWSGLSIIGSDNVISVGSEMNYLLLISIVLMILVVAVLIRRLKFR
jgi:CHAT domain-containing protein